MYSMLEPVPMSRVWTPKRPSACRKGAAENDSSAVPPSPYSMADAPSKARGNQPSA